MKWLLALGLAGCGAHSSSQPPIQNASPPSDPWPSLSAGATYRLRNDVLEQNLEIRVTRIEATPRGRVLHLEWHPRPDRPGLFASDEPRFWRAPITIDPDSVTITFQTTAVRFPRLTDWTSRDGKHWIHTDRGAICYGQGLGPGPHEEGLECGECMDMICLQPKTGVVRAAIWELVGGGIFEPH
jgi:hypothetical protein